MWTAPEIKETVVLPIDVQCRFYVDLPSPRREEFPLKVNAFSQTVSHLGVEVIPVAYETFPITQGLYKPPYPVKYGKTLFDMLTFVAGCYYPDNSKSVFVKGCDDAFNDDVLKSEIEKRSFKDIMIMGINTQACVERSINGAFQNCADDICVHVVYDLLADTCRYPALPDEGLPLSHKNYLEKKLKGKYGDRLSFVTAAEAVTKLTKKADYPKPSPIKQYAAFAVNNLRYRVA